MTFLARFKLPTFLLSALLLTGAAAPKPASLYDIEVKRISASGKDAKAAKLAEYQGKALLIVNTASQCGYTKQYKGLQALHDKYSKEGLVVLGFPSNDYGSQEPGTNAEIKNFCERNFKVTFPLFEKNHVKGDQIQPLYAYLTENAPKKGEVSWNFEKFLVSRDGKVSGRFKSGVAPEDKELTDAIEAELKVKK